MKNSVEDDRTILRFNRDIVLQLPTQINQKITDFQRINFVRFHQRSLGIFVEETRELWYNMGQRSDRIMIDFQKVDLEKREEYLPYLKAAAHRGCGYSFANLYMWGRQKVAVVEDRLAIFSHYSGNTVYPFPAGSADPKAAVDAVIRDAQERGIPFRVTGLGHEEKELLEQWYPGQFRFHCGRDSFDYVYDINDLADLKGRKFQQKRNHANKFVQTYPDFYVKPLDETTLPACKNMVDNWYYRRSMENPHEDIQTEQVAIGRAFRNFRALGLDGLVLYAGGRLAAMTMGSFMDDETVDVHFEKADAEVPGAYAMINREFARYLREKYPNLKYLNREEDLGITGLRKAKLSYNPHHMVEKCWAHLIVEEYDD